MTQKILFILRWIYPFVLAATFWLFFLSTDDLDGGLIGIFTGLNDRITGLAVGTSVFCVVLGIGGLIYSDLEADRKGLCNIRNTACSILSMVSFCIAGIACLFAWVGYPLIVGSYNWLVYVFTKNHDMFSTATTLIACAISCIVLLRIAIKHGKSFRTILVLRMFFWPIIIASVIYLLIYLLYSFGSAYESESVYTLLIPVTLIVIVCIFFYILCYDISFVVFEKKEFILYLRPFSYDYHDTRLKDSLKGLTLPILKIGNPQTILNKGIGQTLFLSSLSWKSMVNYYINKAQFVISVIDDTDGVMWEILTHIDQYEKFIYIIPNKQSIQGLLAKFSENGNIIKDALYFFEQTQTLPQAFCYKENTLYYSSSIQNILNLKINNSTCTVNEYRLDSNTIVISKPNSNDSYVHINNTHACADFLIVLKRKIKNIIFAGLLLFPIVSFLLYWTFFIVLIGLIAIGLWGLFCPNDDAFAGLDNSRSSTILGLIVCIYLLHCLIRDKKK